MSLSWGERLLAVVVGLSDRWLGTHLARRVLAQYDRRIAALQQQLTEIEAQRVQLQISSEALAVSTCAAVLAVLRSSPEGGILFEPGTEHEGLLQTSINMMVKPHLAAIREHPRPDGQFAYEVFPHWDKICEHLLALADRIESQDIAAHVRYNVEQIRKLLR